MDVYDYLTLFLTVHLTLLGLLPGIGVSGVSGQVTPTESFPEEGTVSLATNNRNNDICMLFWKHDGTTITFEIHCRTRGYVGFGISPGGGMDGSDIVIGWVKEGNTYFTVSTIMLYSRLCTNSQGKMSLIFID